MKTTGVYVIAVCALALSGSSLLLSAAPGSAASSDREVVVTNTTDRPVPVVTQGTTNVAGSVSVSNTPNVNVVNVPTVSLDNSEKNPLPVRDVDNPARNVFQGTVNFSIPDGERSVCATLVTVPAGKRLVIEYVSEDWVQRAGLFDPPGEASVSLDTTVNGVQMEYYVSTDIATAVHTRVAQEVRLYADQSTPVLLCVGRPATSGENFGFATISGYLVDMP